MSKLVVQQESDLDIRGSVGELVGVDVQECNAKIAPPITLSRRPRGGQLREHRDFPITDGVFSGPVQARAITEGNKQHTCTTNPLAVPHTVMHMT